MTVQQTQSQVIRDGDGVNRVFDFAFQMAPSSSVEVTEILESGEYYVVPSSEYTVALTEAGGTVTFNVAPEAGKKIALTRVTDVTQLVSVSGQTAYDPRVVESVWDKLTMMVQELNKDLETVLRGAPGSDPEEIYNRFELFIQEAAQQVEDAKGWAQDAEDAKNAAQGYEQQSLSYSQAAADNRDLAGEYRDEAEDARDKAREWATKAEDSPVETGLFSSFHYASKSSQSAQEAEQTKLDLLNDLTATAVTLSPGSPATASWDGVSQQLTLGVPKGDPGEAAGAVLYDSAQSLTEGQEERARKNIGLTISDAALDRLNASKVFDTSEWKDGVATEGGLISPAQLREAAGDKTPVGTISHFALSTPPDGWLVCDGRVITSLYPELRQALIDDGYRWGQDGNGNPRIPNQVDGNRFARAAGGTVPVGTVQGDAIRNITGAVDHKLDGGDTDDPTSALYSVKNDNGFPTGSGRNRGGLRFDASRVVPTAEENRPKAIAYLACIKAFSHASNIPGQAEIDNILQQTQVQVDTSFDERLPPAALDAVAWRQVAKVPVGTVAAVTFTDLDLSKETLVVLSYLSCSSSGNTRLHIEASEDGGSNWLTLPAWLSAERRWDNVSLRGVLETFPDVEDTSVLTSVYTSSPVGGDVYQLTPAVFVQGGGVVLSPFSNTLRFSWGTGSFKASGGSAPDADTIIIYQRG